MHVCISVHTTEKIAILNVSLAIQFFPKVALTEYLWHIFCITIWKHWQWTQDRNGSYLEKWFPSWIFTGHFLFLTVALPLCGLHLAVVERLVYSSEPKSYAGGDFISLAGLTKPDRSKERRQTKQTLWLFDRNEGHLENDGHPEFLSGIYLFPKQCSLKSIAV